MWSVHELSRHHLATLPSIFLSSKRNLQAASFSHGCSKNLAYRAASKEWGAAGEEAEDAKTAGDAAEAAESAEEETGDAADGAAADAAAGAAADAGEAADETAEATEADGAGAAADETAGAVEEEKGDAARDGAESRVGVAALGAAADDEATAEADPQSLRQFLPLTFSRRIPFLSASQKHALGKSTCSDFMTSPMESRLSSMQTKQRHRFFLVLNDRLA